MSLLNLLTCPGLEGKHTTAQSDLGGENRKFAGDENMENLEIPAGMGNWGEKTPICGIPTPLKINMEPEVMMVWFR